MTIYASLNFEYEILIQIFKSKIPIQTLKQSA